MATRRMHFTRRDVVAGLSKYNVIIKNVTGARGIGPVDKVMVEEPFGNLPGYTPFPSE